MPDYTLFDPEEVQTDVEGLVRQIAGTHGVDPDHIVRMAKQESGLDPSTPPSKRGAIGVMQLLPGTAKDYLADPNDLHQNIDAGVRYYKDLLQQFGGDTVKATAAYNFGPTRVARGDPWPKETRDYVKAVTGKNGNGKQPNWEAEFDPSQIEVVGDREETAKPKATVDFDPAEVQPVAVPTEAELTTSAQRLAAGKAALEQEAASVRAGEAALTAQNAQLKQQGDALGQQESQLESMIRGYSFVMTPGSTPDEPPQLHQVPTATGRRRHETNAGGFRGEACGL